MKKRILCIIMAFSMCFGAAPLSHSAETETPQTPLLMQYDEAGTDWEKEGLPIGNGFMGATVHGGVQEDLLLLNEKTIWSGGPGANAAYDGGHNEKTAEENYDTLAAVRQELQENMSDFSENSSAYVDENGAIVSENYPAMSETLTNNFNALKGEKTNFGAYQELGYLKVTEDTLPLLVDSYHNCPYGEPMSVLSDGVVNTVGGSWFSEGNGGSKAKGQTFPIFTWQYNKKLPIESYTVSLGKDSVAHLRCPTNFKLYGSDNGTEWTELDAQTNVSWAAALEVKTFYLSAVANYSYYRFEVTANNGTWGTEIGEFSLNPFSASGVQRVKVSHNCNTNDSADRLFDGKLDVAGSWFSVAGRTWGTNSVFPAEITAQYSGACWVTGYTVTNGRNAVTYGRSPAEIKFYGSADGSTWVELDHRTGLTWTGTNEVKNFDIAVPGRYTYYKLSVLANQGIDPRNGNAAWGTEIAELELHSPDFAEAEEEVAAEEYLRTLDLDRAIATVSYRQDGVNYQREYFASNPENAIIVRYTADEKVMDRYVSMTSAQTSAKITAEGNTLTITGRSSDQKENLEHLEFAGQIKVVTDGTCEATNGLLWVKDASEIVIYITAGTNYQQCTDDSYDYFKDEAPLVAVAERMEAVSAKSFDTLKEEHIADHKALFDNVRLDLGGGALPAKMTDDLLDGYKKQTNTAEEDRYLSVAEGLYPQQFVGHLQFLHQLLSLSDRRQLRRHCRDDRDAVAESGRCCV